MFRGKLRYRKKHHVTAADYDGTIARDGRLGSAVRQAIHNARKRDVLVARDTKSRKSRLAGLLIEQQILLSPTTLRR